MEPIQFIDLKAQRQRIESRLDAAIARVLDEGRFIMGPQVEAFERELAAFCGATHVIGCGNGTDAIGLCLMALAIGPGDAVLVPSFTFAATAEAVVWGGATPIFVDIDRSTYTIDPASLAIALKLARDTRLKPRAVIAVDLFGQPADYEEIEAFCAREGLVLICDAAQSVGASYDGRSVGTFGAFTTTSFFPSKPLGCYGDGGAVFTANDDHAALIRSLHVHGKGADKYDNVRVGVNSRLDTVQAAVLSEKLAIFADEIVARQRVAERYATALGDRVVVPAVRPRCRSVWAQFVIRVPAERRAGFIASLASAGVPTAIYYPRPLHRQTAYRHLPVARGELPVSDQVAEEVVALPMHAYLEEPAQDYIVKTVHLSLKD